MSRWRRFKARLKAALRGDFGMRPRYPRSFRPVAPFTVYVNEPTVTVLP